MASAAGYSLGLLRVSGGFQGNFHGTWSFDEFKSYDSHPGDFYDSGTFDLEEKGIKWFLRLYPAGKSKLSKDLVSCCVFVDSEKTNLKIKCNLSFRDTEDKVLLSKTSKDWAVVTSEGIMYDNLIRMKNLGAKLSPLDVLVIAVEVTYCVTYTTGEDRVEIRRPEITPMVHVINDLRDLWTSKENTDCVVSVDGHDIAVHSIILGARSRVFETMFNKDDNNHRVEVSDFGKGTMESFMEFIYTGSLSKMGLDLAVELLRASDKYKVSDLKSFCSNYLTSILDQWNVCKILVAADVSGAKELRSSALEYFSDEMTSDSFDRKVFETRPRLLCDIVVRLLDTKNQK